jgi:two-component system, NtrC family, sensor kinase
LNKYFLTLFLCIMTLSVTADLRAADTLWLSSENLADSDGIILDSNWKYQAGDDMKWAFPEYDDSHWSDIVIGFPFAKFESEWQGNGWFRRHLRVDKSLRNKTIALSIRQLGAVEIYLNGRLVKSYGTYGHSADEEIAQHITFVPPNEFKLDSLENQVLAIRYSNYQSVRIDHGIGFIIKLWRLDAAKKYYSDAYRSGLSHQMLFSGLSMAFCLIAFLMFAFPPRAKENLLFALFALGCVGLSFMPILANLSVKPESVLLFVYMSWASILFACLFGLWFLYALFYSKMPRILWIFIAIVSLMLITLPLYKQTMIYGVAIIYLFESTRVVVAAIIKKKANAWIIGIGYLLFGTACMYQMLADMGILKILVTDFWYYYMYGILALLISEAVYLARQFSHTNLDLIDQLEQVKGLSAKTIEQERQAKEQEIARSVLQKEFEFQKVQLEEAKKLEKALSDLEAANKEIRDTQSQLIQSEKMASMGMLVAGVAHEINTPVGAIRSMHDTLVRAMKKINSEVEDGCTVDGETKARLCKYLKIVSDANNVIDSGSERVAAIVKRLRSFARLDEAELLKADIHECIEDTLMLAHHELKHNVEIIKEFGVVPQISCFAGQLNQVFLNILINARQSIKDKGWIKIKTSVENDRVVIKFTDNGGGIPDNVIGKIFDPGFTTKGVGVGTGLGLSICYQIIQSHKGEITVESEEGKGTTFTISLPMNLNKILGI